MQIYRITWDEGATPHFAGTLGDAHASAKLAPAPASVLIELLDVDVSKDSALAMLGGGMPAHKVLRTWGLTPRRGLKEQAP
ncbi:hypothetical protein [Caldimonas sp. KR1-144]|uniref:hypothetical protein n=1 Tax=Caldimonas sp. KR1-144 TaxID=3400911 RepID=UPI003BFE1E49